MADITQNISDIPLLKHRDTVVSLADQDEFVSKFEATMDTLSNNTVVELNTFKEQVNTVKDETNTAKDTAVAKAQEASNSATNASQSETNAEDFKALAQSYANANEDVEVEVGLYSAKHFSLKAAQSIAALPEGTINDGITSTSTAWSSDKIDTALDLKADQTDLDTTNTNVGTKLDLAQVQATALYF